MNARRQVESEQVESEYTRDVPLPEKVRGERRGQSVVRSVLDPRAGLEQTIELRADVEWFGGGEGAVHFASIGVAEFAGKVAGEQGHGRSRSTIQ